MPDEDKKMVPIDTSGPDATVDIEEVKDESKEVPSISKKKKKTKSKKEA